MRAFSAAIFVLGMSSGMMLHLKLAQATTVRPSVEAETVTEIKLLSNAISSYAIDHREFPPCMATDDPDREERLKQHIRRAFPRHEYEDGLPSDLDLKELDPAEALVFFLGGVPSDNGFRECLGFSPNPRDPMSRTLITETGKRIKRQSFFEFEISRLTDLDGDGFWEYLPPESKVPYVYFDAKSYGRLCQFPEGQGVAVAYKKSKGSWYLPEGCQIIAPGGDNHYGEQDLRIFPGENGFTEGDYDNLTNFLKASFSTLLLRERTKLGYGWPSIIVVNVLSILAAPMVLAMWRTKSHFSVRKLMLLITFFGFVFGVLSWDAHHLGASKYLWFVLRSCTGSALALFWLSAALTTLYAASSSANSRWARHIHDMVSWWTVWPFLFIWWLGPSVLLNSGAFSPSYHIGWPCKIVTAGQMGVSVVAAVLDVLVGVSVGIVGRWLIWNPQPQASEELQGFPTGTD